jgi:hypothetical protein
MANRTNHDRSGYRPRMTDETKMAVIAEWDSGRFPHLQALGRHFNLQRSQVSRILCTRLNYVEDRGRPIKLCGKKPS